MQYIFTLLAMVMTCSAYCQVISTPYTVRTPQGNVTLYTHQNVSQPMHYNYGSDGPVSKKYKFKVVMKSDSIFSAKTTINFSDVYDDDKLEIRNKQDEVQTVYPKNTKSISRITSDGKELVGIPSDSCWLFKTSSGKINSYSFLAEPITPYVTAIQKGNKGPIVPLTKANLSAMVGANPKVEKLINADKLVRAIELYNNE